jgi:hypothetical protein
MVMYEDNLTTETLRKKFKNNFNLCNFSIQVGRDLILRGEQPGLRDVLEAVNHQIDIKNETGSS